MKTVEFHVMKWLREVEMGRGRERGSAFVRNYENRKKSLEVG